VDALRASPLGKRAIGSCLANGPAMFGIRSQGRYGCHGRPWVHWVLWAWVGSQGRLRRPGGWASGRLWRLVGEGRSRRPSGRKPGCEFKTEAHPEPSSKRIKHVSFATLSGHLMAGVHDRPFKQHLTKAFSAKSFKQGLIYILSVGWGKGAERGYEFTKPTPSQTIMKTYRKRVVCNVFLSFEGWDT
jgi:hypothetical protein